MNCLNMLVIFLGLNFMALSSCYTITKDEIPTLPTETLVDNSYLVRNLPNGEAINITCLDDTVLNEETLTCDFKSISKRTLFYVLPSEDCRMYQLCDGRHCEEMPCPSNTLFNVNTKSCDYPERTNCCEFDAKNSSRILPNQ